VPPKNVEEMLKENMIIGKEETYDSMCKRVYLTIAEESRKYGANDIQIKEFANTLETLFKNDIIVPSTPILTNAGRFDDRPLSACSVPPLDYKLDRTKLAELVRDYHKKGMGTGFNFDDSANPVEELLFFNNHASEEFKRKEMEIKFLSFTRYFDSSNLPSVFPPEEIRDVLGEVILKNGIPPFFDKKTGAKQSFEKILLARNKIYEKRIC